MREASKPILGSDIKVKAQLPTSYLLCMIKRPTHGSNGVIMGRRKTMLRGEAIING